ncbi:MAG: hypothetical protein NTV61_00380 [Candidatus Bathyarchaeota archaeon]|nr:hypothetical protein [Candidatus Bathyarchaeota archaeon]
MAIEATVAESGRPPTPFTVPDTLSSDWTPGSDAERRMSNPIAREASLLVHKSLPANSPIENPYR